MSLIITDGIPGVTIAYFNDSLPRVEVTICVLTYRNNQCGIQVFCVENVGYGRRFGECHWCQGVCKGISYLEWSVGAVKTVIWALC